MAQSEKQVTAKEDAMNAITVGLAILGNPMTRIAEILNVHRDSVKRYMESNEAGSLIEPFKNLIVMAHGRATEGLLQDLSS